MFHTFHFTPSGVDHKQADKPIRADLSTARRTFTRLLLSTHLLGAQLLVDTLQVLQLRQGGDGLHADRRFAQRVDLPDREETAGVCHLRQHTLYGRRGDQLGLRHIIDTTAT